MEKGKIILFNGVSSSGKTALAKTLQNRLSEIFFRFDIDMYAQKGFDINMLTEISPERFKNYSPSLNNADTISNLTGFYNVIKIFSDLGMNVIVDTMFAKKALPLYICLDILDEYPVLFVHVTCSPEELRRREKKRGNREIGHGEAQLTLIEPQDTYDITVDTFYETNEECADKIIELLKHTEKHTAFNTLCFQREKWV